VQEQLLNHRYRLIEVIRVGRRSVVWRAYDEDLNRPVAVRIFVGSHTIGIPQRGAVSHPNVAATYDHGDYTDDQGLHVPFVVTELVAGESLATRHEILSPSSALHIGAQVASALAAAHEAGVVHGNIKPSNIVLTPTGVKVVDFGMPFTTGDATSSGDVCALGLLVYWMLVREVPWPSEMSASALLAHLGSEPGRLPALPQLPDEVLDVCLRCLERDPDQRPSAGEVASVLNSVPLDAVPLDAAALASATLDSAAPDSAVLDSAVEYPPLATMAAGWLVDEPAANTRNVSLKRMASVTAAMTLVVAVGLAFMVSGKAGPETAARAPLTTTDRPISTTPSAPSTTMTSPEATPSPTPPPTTAAASPSPSPEPTTPVTLPPPPPPPPAGQSVSGIGGTIFVTCRLRIATVTSVQPAQGFFVQSQSLGPAREIQVVFSSLPHRTDIRARCGANGGVDPTVRESN
jgi:serine/threonine-protein kinase